VQALHVDTNVPIAYGVDTLTPGRSCSNAKAPLLFRWSGQQQVSRANPVGSTAGGSGIQRECEEPSPSTTGGNAGEGVSLRSIRKKKNKDKGRVNIFKIPLVRRFGLKIECRDAKSSAVYSVSCRFCCCFVREPQRGLAAAGKRKALQSMKAFSKTWGTDAYEQHLKLLHPTKWCEYGMASHAEQEAFFDVAVDEVAHHQPRCTSRRGLAFLLGQREHSVWCYSRTVLRSREGRASSKCLENL
jgi:hypothetical protein